MTGRELYEQLKEHGAEDCELIVTKENGTLSGIDEVAEVPIAGTDERKVVLR